MPAASLVVLLLLLLLPIHLSLSSPSPSPNPSSTASPSLYQSLQSLRYLNDGRTSSTSRYAYSAHPVLYGEPENVSTTNAWWGVSGTFPLLYALNTSHPSPPPPPTACTPSTVYPGEDMPGGDIATHVLPSPSPPLCASLCCRTPGCLAYTVALAPGPFMQCIPSQPCCYLKGSIPPHIRSSVPNITSGLVHPAPNPYTVHPPSGMRSAVPLGGVGAGSVELRGDGSLHEWTIANQSPGGAAKYGVVDEAVMAVRVAPVGGGGGGGGEGEQAGVVARLIRTQPPLGLPGVAGLRYRGSYPVSRLDVEGEGEEGLQGVQVAVFAYYALRPFDLNRSVTPALVLTLTAHNPTAEAREVGFMLSLPWGVESDQTRAGPSPPLRTLPNVTTPAACMQLCGGEGQCASWTWVRGECAMSAQVPLNRYQAGASSGVKGTWQWQAQEPSSPSGFSSAASSPLRHVRAVDPHGPASGDLSLWPTSTSSSPSPPTPTYSYATGDCLPTLFSAFAATGRLNSSGPSPTLTPTPTTTTTTTAVHGAAAITTTLPPGQNATLSVVFAWYFPHRDHVGQDVGNFYANLFEDSAEAAKSMVGVGGEGLVEVVDDIAALHATYLDSTLPEYAPLPLLDSHPPTPSPLPSLSPDRSPLRPHLVCCPLRARLRRYLVDSLVNSFSHVRSAMYVKDGTWRQWEAYDVSGARTLGTPTQRTTPILASPPCSLTACPPSVSWSAV